MVCVASYIDMRFLWIFGVRFPMVTILATSKLTVRYQVTIPSEVREKLNLEGKAGTTVVFAEDDGKIVLLNPKMD
ncbi:MAG: hypothetical protein NPMRTH1_400009 [Nitrosopumilales archaeon]|nr:MAG: hypothetical protein NPMRTH1_400009 [Nitrosopumilales archaeon]